MQTLIEENDVTAVNLSVELERVVIAHTLDDDKSIYVTESDFFPFWVKLNEDAHLVIFSSYTLFTHASSRLERLELCNSLNYSQYMLTVSVRENKMVFDHALSFRDGLLRENLIRSMRMFSTNIIKGLSRFDPDHTIALLPGTEESTSTDQE
jgi:hypothetical protein